MIEPDEWPKCPVCQARFRDASVCSRCGADLEPLMFLIANAYQLRQDARRALQAGDFERAQKLALDCSLCRPVLSWFWCNFG